MSISRTYYNTIVIGAGPSGLAASFCLKQKSIDYTVLEGSDRVANSWHFVWPNFQFAQTVGEIAMPGLNLSEFNSAHHLKRDEIITVFERYQKQHDLNIKFNIKVTSIQKDQREIYHVNTSHGEYTTKNVILSIGARQQPKFPTFLDGIQINTRKSKIMHSAWYQGAYCFPFSSKILVVGSGLSALGITKDLASQSDFKHDVSIACRYCDAQIKKNNQHLLDVSTTLDDLAKMGIKNWGELRDINVEKNDLVFSDNQIVNLFCFYKIIFATGYNTSYELLNQLLQGNIPKQQNGITTESGLYMVGIPSAEEKTVTITKGGKEAENIVTHIYQRLQITSFMLSHQLSSPTSKTCFGMRKKSLYGHNTLFVPASKKQKKTKTEQSNVLKLTR
ncbi:MAG TPA: NAD(P)-binding domain-containing protein [Gammaproteobacteria bacterium]|nr:NAD(P)-binding domain-containing protein [Gammaproteobacteria bacterium]